MRWLSSAVALAALIALAGGAQAAGAAKPADPATKPAPPAPAPRVITLECTLPAKPPLRGMLRLSCKVKDDAGAATLALIDPFGTNSWQTMDPFAPGDHVAPEPSWQSRSVLVDPFGPSGTELRDPFSGDLPDEP
jgi:hypothetical protein